MSPGAPASYTERFLARERTRAAMGRMLGALAAAPLVAGAWWGACVQARAVEAGRFTWSSDLDGLIFEVFTIGLHARFGMTGLHVAFGAVLAGVAAVGVHGWLVDRRITREVGRGALDELVRVELASTLARVLLVAVPLGSIALTAWLVSKALRT